MTRYEQLKSDLKANPKTWLVTGAAGFIGSNLVEQLLKLDQDVIGIDNFSTGHRKNLTAISELVSENQFRRFEFVEADICDPDICSAACKGVDYVLHQAALGSVPRSVNDPITTHHNNATGVLNMLVAAKDAEVSGFVYASSSSVYGDQPDLPKVEEKTGNVLSPYAATKQFAEIYADVFAKTYDFRTIGLRYFNVFGPRQDPDGAYAAVIPKWVASIIKGEEIFINGDGETSRDFCYVDNAVQANLLAATADESAINRVYNIAVGERTTLNELYNLIQDGLATRIRELVESNPTYRDFRVGDIRHSLADISAARMQLGYSPACTVGQGLELALDNYVESVRPPQAQSTVGIR